MDNDAKILDVRNIDIVYNRGKADEVRILNKSSFYVKPGEVVLIIGENGAGKSTLLKSLFNGLDDRSACQKEMYFDGKLISSSSDYEYFRKSIGFAMQEDDRNPLFDRRVEDYVKNYAYSSEDPSGCEEYFEELYENKLECENYLRKVNLRKMKLKKCSGGQLKLVSLLKTFSRKNAKLFILDEPINNLDANHARILNDFITDLKSESNAGVLIVTHCQMFGNVDRAYELKDNKLNEVLNYQAKTCFGKCIDGYYNYDRRKRHE